MTIKRYNPEIQENFYGGDPVAWATMEENVGGGYLSKKELLERLKDIKDDQGAWGMLMFKLDKLIKELQ